jgi:hypothetical protein
LGEIIRHATRGFRSLTLELGIRISHERFSLLVVLDLISIFARRVSIDSRGGVWVDREAPIKLTVDADFIG